MMGSISASQVIYIGGTHDNIEAHKVQLQIIQLLVEESLVAIGLKMFCRSAMVVGHAGWVVPSNDSEALCSVWREIFLLEGVEFRGKAVAARDRFMSQFSINVLLKSTEQVLCGEVGCAELPGGAVKGSEIHRDG